MHDEVLGIIGHLAVAVADLAQRGADGDGGEAQARVHHVPVQIRGCGSAGFHVGGHDVVAPTELRETRHLEHVGQRLEERVHEDQPADVDSCRSEVDHLPVEHRGGLESVEEDVARPGVAPVDDRRAGCGRLVVGQPREGLLDHRQAQIAPRPVVVRPLLGEKPIDGVTAAIGQERQVEAGAGGRVEVDGVDAGLQSGHLATQFALLVHAELVHVAAAEHVGRHVGKSASTHAVHHDERRTQDALVGLEEAHVGHGHVAVRADQTHGAGLSRQVVHRKHRPVVHVGAQSGDDRFALAVVMNGEQ